MNVYETDKAKDIALYFKRMTRDQGADYLITLVGHLEQSHYGFSSVYGVDCEGRKQCQAARE